MDATRLDLLRDGSLPARWLARWSENPSEAQLRDCDGRWLSAAEIEQRSRALAVRLRSAGLMEGDRLLLRARTGAPFVLAVIAALRARLTVVPLNPAYTRAETARILHHARPAMALVDDSSRAQELANDAPGPLPVHGLDGPRHNSSADVELDRARGEDVALLIYTSGTTGAPKGAPLSHANLLASASALELAWRWQPDDRLLLALPLFHVHGLGVGVIGTLCAGASVELHERFQVADTLERCGSGEVSLLFGVPTMYRRLAASGRAGELARLRLIVSGSAPLPAELARALERETGQLPLERYGMTETVMLTSNPCEGERRAGTVGLALPGVALRLSQEGEIQVRGPNVISGYWRDQRATAAAFDADGFFCTGDLGEFDDAGYLRIAGRRKELIITGGLNVHPREVEERLAEHPSVAEVAVVGRPSAEWGEEVVAVVVPSSLEDGIDPEQLRAHAAATLAPYKVPKRFEQVTELPRNALGKLVRSLI
jgi:malonyl-CoA/methylmalonyl-CoA synthetase